MRVPPVCGDAFPRGKQAVVAEVVVFLPLPFSLLLCSALLPGLSLILSPSFRRTHGGEGEKTIALPAEKALPALWL